VRLILRSVSISIIAKQEGSFGQPPSAAYSCSGMLTAGEPGGGGICVMSWADAPPVGVQERGGGGGKGIRRPSGSQER